MERPNIVFFFSDQQRWDTVGAYGQRLDVTPHLDKMAEQGVLFNNAFTCQPVCGPARSCLQTGLYATETGSYTNGIALNPQVTHMADLFNEAGYETAYVGKWHLASGCANDGSDHRNNYETTAIPKHLRGGYKDWWIASDILEFTSHGYGGYMFDAHGHKRNFEHYRADATTDFALEYLEQKTTGTPFFLMISYIEPHHQNDRETYEGPKGSKDKFAEYDVPGDLIGTQGDWREHYPDYLGCCNSLDMNLGRIRDKLEAMGIADKTVIFYSSDHGSHFKTRNSEYKRSCHEGCVRIPMVAYGPGFTGGKKIEELVSLMDIPKTFLDIAHIESPQEWQGNSLKQLVAGETDHWPDEVYIQISESQCGRAIRTKRWKYAVWTPEGVNHWKIKSDLYEEAFLYDLEKDPHERHNLVREQAYNEVRATLKQQLLRRLKAANEGDAVIIPNTTPI